MLASVSNKPRMAGANIARTSTLLRMLAMSMDMRAIAMGMMGQVAMCVVRRDPVTTTTPDHPRFVGALLIDGMGVTQRRVHAAMGHRHLALGEPMADRTRKRQVGFVHRPPVREHAMASAFICIERHFWSPKEGRGGISRTLPLPRLACAGQVDL